MNLPPIAINALVAIKARIEASRELQLAQQREAAEAARVSAPKPMREERQRRSHVMRHARERHAGFQRMCRRKDSGWGGR